MSDFAELEAVIFSDLLSAEPYMSMGRPSASGVHHPLRPGKEGQRIATQALLKMVEFATSDFPCQESDNRKAAIPVPPTQGTLP
jgi:hypothetical protein